ncbi:MAG TPA: hypothetical protein VGS57_15815 [Thermoanaerobaculia bacterium]|jgi:hypothetical protein|nr:hypothetical protein [Thermoanaerobaculia bacterium]
MFGFSVSCSNAFSETLERRCRMLDRSFRESNLALSLGLRDLHEAVDEALAGDAASSAAALERGLAQLAVTHEQLTVLGQELVQSRADLFERGKIDPVDPLIAREPCFAALDYDGLYQDLVSRGAALPQRVYWTEIATRIREGGARAGLRLLDRQLRQLQSRLRTFIDEATRARAVTLSARAARLHDTSIEVFALVQGFTQLLTTMNYMSIICERASQLYERELEEAAAPIAVAG